MLAALAPSWPLSLSLSLLLQDMQPYLFSLFFDVLFRVVEIYVQAHQHRLGVVIRHFVLVAIIQVIVDLVL